jgi:GTP pyrophosphokinase
MVRTGKSLEEIMDRIGIRIILRTVPKCYMVLGLLHTHFKPIRKSLDDYIGFPKENGYQSLHTCVYPVREISHKPIEFQIRTELMHKEAEYGAAAHWHYKNDTIASGQDFNHIQWIKGLMNQHQKAESTEAFIDLLHRQVFGSHLVIFGSGGRIVRLSEKATVQDYLTVSNIELDRSMIVKVNERAANTDRILKDGDSIEIISRRK